MKASNGSSVRFQAPQTPTPSAQEMERAFAALHKFKDSRRPADRKAMVTIELNSSTYGMFAAAGIVHNCSVKEAIEMLLEGTDTVCEWAGDNFPAEYTEE